jgi:DNA-binding CsgD family transcriptional regulator
VVRARPPAGRRRGRRLDAAAEIFERASAEGDRFGEPDLVALARAGHGHVLIATGRPRDGTALLDEAMVSVTAGELTPITTGAVYCTVIDVCQSALDVRRAREWTSALEQWWSAQPGLVPFTGACLVHRAHLTRIHGDWPLALAEASDACERLTLHDPRAAATGFVEIGELRCLRGELDLADDAFRRAAALGRDPQPGLALLLLARGRVAAASAAISRTVADPGHPADRASVLAAAVEILVAAGDVEAARRASDELAVVALARATPWLDGLSADATGAVLLAQGEAERALPVVRRAWSVWLQLGAPYEGARSQLQVARALGGLGDPEAAHRERDAALATLRSLGAGADREISGTAGGLTAREAEVLRLVATGLSNRTIADELVLSEKTVARHVSNIFGKLGVHSRAAAGMWAHTHGVVRAP